MRRQTFLASGAAALVASGLPAARADNAVRMPALIENNRIYANFDFPYASGGTEPLRTWVDTGGGAVIVAREIAEKLGWKIETTATPHQGFLPFDLHAVYVNEVRLPVPFAATTVTQSSVVMPGMSVAADLPGRVLADHVMTFDYPKSEIWIDGPPLPSGITLLVGIQRKSAFPRVELEIDGERMGFLLDTGASFTMLSQAVIDRLHAKHPDWIYIPGAYGPANMIGKGDLASHMLRIPSAKWGPFEITPFDVVSRAAGTFETFMSPMMSAPIAGSLAGNVLRNFALRLDYPNSMLDAVFTLNPWAQAFTMVPLIVHVRADGSYEIAGGAASAGIAGAQIVAIESQAVKGASLAQVQDLLRGKAGDVRAVRVRDQHGERKVGLHVTKIW